jgi:pyruvate dehydrogenase E2 component (dihydrolipoamide acetyltransferase)
MPIEIRLPELSASMTEATVLVWRKRPGEAVKPGDVLVEIETDKSAVELEASDEGTLLEILVQEGAEGVPVGALLALLARPGEASAMGASPLARESQSPAAPAPAAASEIAAAAGSKRAAHATPLARRMAEQAGIALDSIRGSGAGGRIMKCDVEAARGMRPLAAALAEPTRAAPQTEVPPVLSRFARARGGGDSAARQGPELPAEAPFHEVRHTMARRTQAARLAESKRTVPHFYLTVDCELDALLALREQLNERSAREGEPRFSVNDLVVRAAALALRRVPAANVSFTEDALRIYDRVDVAVAVATDSGVVTPIVRDADRKGLADLSRELRDLGERARERRLRPEEYQGGTLTVSNLGMYGIQSLLPILNPPQSCILGVGAAEPRPVARDGAVVVRTIMTCTLSADHRALDGATGAELLTALRRGLEDPLSLLL